MTMRYSYEFLREDESVFLEKITACLVFAEKPMKFMILGKTNSGGGDGVKAIDALAKFLPMHPDEFIAQMEYGSMEDRKSFELRQQFSPAFRNVNGTSIKNIALMFQEATWGMPVNTKVIAQYYQKYDRKPSERTVPEEIRATGPKTYEIQTKILKQFVGMSHVWKPILPNIKKAYSATLSGMSKTGEMES
jgi:hypothetical protein